MPDGTRTVRFPWDDEPTIENAAAPADEETADWTPRARQFWRQLTALERETFHGPGWVKPAEPAAPVRVVVDFWREAKRDRRPDLTIDDLLSIQWPDGFRGGVHGPFHAGWAKDKWDADERADLGEKLRALTCSGYMLRRKFEPEECLLGSIVTSTSRTFLIGSTGTGKTHQGMAWAGGCASGIGFGRWRACRPSRVLWIDGEMPLPLLRDRIADMERRQGSAGLSNIHWISWQDEALLAKLGLTWAPLNTPEGHQFVIALCDLIKPDSVFLDNVQSLCIGDMREETSWTAAMPVVLELTARRIGQVWMDHTGHDKTRQYGASRKAASFDNLGIMQSLPLADRQPSELAFTLSFEAKARRRTPENWQEFEAITIRLRDDRWMIDGRDDDAATPPPAGKPANVRLRPAALSMHNALINVLAITETPGETTEAAWIGECLRMGLIPDPKRTGSFRARKAELVAAGWIACDGPRVFNRHPAPAPRP